MHKISIGESKISNIGLQNTPPGSDTDSEDEWENLIHNEITVNDNTTDEDDRHVMELDRAKMNESGEEMFYEIEKGGKCQYGKRSNRAE